MKVLFRNKNALPLFSGALGRTICMNENSEKERNLAHSRDHFIYAICRVNYPWRRHFLVSFYGNHFQAATLCLIDVIIYIVFPVRTRFILNILSLLHVLQHVFIYIVPLNFTVCHIYLFVLST